MFSKTCEYAIRAVILIAEAPEEGNRLSVKDIASGIDAPEHFIAKILQDLSKKGLVKSAKGPRGGFYHDEKTLQNSLIEVVKAVDGEELFTGCGLGLKECSEDRPCPIHHQFKEVRREIKVMLEEAKVGALSTALSQKLVFLKR